MALSITAQIDALCSQNDVFARLKADNGYPPEWRRAATFGSLTLLVLEQQVSLASARAAYLRLEDRLGSVEPGLFLALDDDELRAVGFSRQKASYVRGIADELLSGELDLERVTAMSADDAIERLVSIRGIGVWTASCFALFVNGAPDIWPSGDRALYVSMRDVFDLDDVPARDDADAMASEWSPFRSAAARMLWYDYLGGKDYVAPDRDGFLDTTGMVQP